MSPYYYEIQNNSCIIQPTPTGGLKLDTQASVVDSFPWSFQTQAPSTTAAVIRKRSDNTADVEIYTESKKNTENHWIRYHKPKNNKWC